MKIQSLLNQARALGLRLEPKGNKLLVSPAENCTAQIVAELRRHKTQVLAELKGKSARTPLDCAPSLHIIKQVLAGEFDGADRFTVERLSIGLRPVAHPLCRRALERLQRQSHDQSDNEP